MSGGLSFAFGAVALIVVTIVGFVVVGFSGLFVMVVGVVTVLFRFVAALLAVLVPVAGFGFVVSGSGLRVFGAGKVRKRQRGNEGEY